jgi:hypothetical protein
MGRGNKVEEGLTALGRQQYKGPLQGNLYEGSFGALCLREVWVLLHECRIDGREYTGIAGELRAN